MTVRKEAMFVRTVKGYFLAYPVFNNYMATTSFHGLGEV
jgi:hypothetical protein